MTMSAAEFEALATEAFTAFALACREVLGTPSRLHAVAPPNRVMCAAAAGRVLLGDQGFLRAAERRLGYPLTHEQTRTLVTAFEALDPEGPQRVAQLVEVWRGTRPCARLEVYPLGDEPFTLPLDPVPDDATLLRTLTDLIGGVPQLVTLPGGARVAHPTLGEPGRGPWVRNEHAQAFLGLPEAISGTAVALRDLPADRV